MRIAGPSALHPHTKVPHLLDTSSSRILGDGSHIQHPKSSAIVGLVRESVRNILVVVNALGSTLIQPSLLGGPELRNVPDICDWMSLSTSTGLVVLVILVVEK